MIHQTASCTCDLEEYGDAETGPRVSLVPDESCPDHGREADPEGWAYGDAMERGHLLSGVLATLRADSFLGSYEEARALVARVGEDAIVALDEVALAEYVYPDDAPTLCHEHDAGSCYDGCPYAYRGDDGHDFDRASTDVARALVALLASARERS